MMATTAALDRCAAAARDAARRRSRRWASTTHWIRHRLLPAEAFVLPALLALTALLGVLAHLHTPWIQTSMVTLPLLLGGFTLRFTAQLVLLSAAAVVVLADSAAMRPPRPDPGTVLLVGTTALVVLVMSRERVRLGVRGTRGESMLFDLRERLQAQGRVPLMPDGWNVDLALKSADGQSFGGDFVIAARSDHGSVLQLGLVDVSGKGLEAGARALLLSGAFGGLLGSVPAGEFLASANRYLLRQGWEEGFATAVHLVLDLRSGEFDCYSAGHPPIARLNAGAGEWELCETPGPVLGVLPEVVYRPTRGRLVPGDALLLFTDGLVERPGKDLAVGLDRLLGAAQGLQTRGFADGAARIIDTVARSVNDDRALVLLCRSAA
ncbi:serine/threonine-protein phosphatase [Actinospica durhamensis]|uniref:Serine/threonine-protein phosphatase n=1 Tax=Actinospica durhamensis TaxID=1508375 RepID=A0A941EWG3_9ACTN|nr:PP2C family protein-serine/threonine phosphatase [Actinospica durhamensis]MBR7838221.1 serine/threonine-protein phosphatase [Actinospica durhamensis]